MRFFIILGLAVSIVSCGTPSTKNNNVIGPPTPEPKPAPKPVVIPAEPESTIPYDAAYGNYLGNNRPFYSYVKSVNTKKGVTRIAFENKSIPTLLIPDTYGAVTSPLALYGFDRDLLFVKANIKDINFNKYYVYVLRNNQWKEVVNSFAIHKSNLKEIDRPIWNDPSDTNFISRHYSVFNLDETSSTGYTWLVHEERIPVLNR